MPSSQPMEMFYLFQDWMWSWSSAMGKCICNDWGGIRGNGHQNYCVYTLRGKHFGCVHVLLCHFYLAIGLSKLTIKWAADIFHDIGQPWVVVFQYLDWDSEGGIAWDMFLCFMQEVRSREPDTRPRNQKVGPMTSVCSSMLPDLFGWPLGGNIDPFFAV